MIDRLKRRLSLTGDDRDALLADLLEDAEQFILVYTGRAAFPEALVSVKCELAAAAYNLLGLEGLSAHAEGDVSATIDALPAHMRSLLNLYRIARVG